MPRYEFIKTIDAHKLNKRSGLPLNEPAVPIPYSAIVEKEEERWDYVKFSYLGQRYQCPTPIFKEAARPYGSAGAAPGPPPASAAEAAEDPTPRPAVEAQMKWEELTSTHHTVLRAKVKGGWLVSVRASGVAFYPDPKHSWDGRTEE
jgi:hypothetical protein